MVIDIITVMAILQHGARTINRRTVEQADQVVARDWAGMGEQISARPRNR